MKPYLELGLMPLIAALIGWGTNLLAIKLIVRPLNPVKIPLLGIEIQGLIPKRRFDISRSIGEALEHEIISPEEIIDNLAGINAKADIIKHIKELTVRRVGEKLPGFIPSSFREFVANFIGEMIDKNGTEIFDEIKTAIAKKAKEQLNLKQLVEDKINSFDIEQLEDLIIRLSRQELKQIEVLGGVIGFFIGIIQVAISYYLL
ncbi:MAG: DUF445 family protein [Thermoanaerobacteraceae bacterium]|nr:DUF445 family protein [Thermoanaerobacteraceae bacterium]